MAKNKKRTIITDSFEQVAELGKTTVKSTVKTTKNIVMDLGTAKALEQLVTGSGSGGSEKLNGNKNHTPLDIENLKGKYEQQDKQKEESLKMRLFHLSRQEEGRVLAEKKQEEKQKEQQLIQEDQEKKRKEEEEKKKQAEQGQVLPSGKKRRSIFSPKKKASEQHMETRPASGKQ